MSAQRVLPSGPVFISYRQSDGQDIATALAWLLRAAGIPVWQDQSDLPPGDTEERLTQALDSGLSGACLLATKDIAKSGVVRTIELPQLYVLARDPAFVFAVANTVRKRGGKLDYEAPDRLLAQPEKLAAFKQYPADTRQGLLDVVGELLDARAHQVRQRRAPSDPAQLRISVQTRTHPQAHPGDGADLSIRLRLATHGRLPDVDGLSDLRDGLRLLPRAVARAAATEVVVTGGAHLSVAFALGASLPATLVPQMSVEVGQGETWTTGTVSAPSPAALTRLESHGMRPLPAAGVRREVLAYVDLLPSRSDAPYTRMLSETTFDAHEQICPRKDGPLDPASAGPLIEEVADRLRSLVSRHDHARLHLLLRCPFPVAVLLGRLCNTLRVVTYEWDDAELPGDADARPRYVPALEANATQAHGPITDVLLTPQPISHATPGRPA